MADDSTPTQQNAAKGESNAADDAKKQDQLRKRAESAPEEQPDNADDIPENVLQEAAREHQDTYMVKSDLEDADQRSIPGTREQP